MAATLNTRLDALMFSSQVPDILISVTDDSEAEIMLDVPDMTIFSAVHFPYGHNITIHDLRSVIEYYLRDRDISLDEFALRVKHNGAMQTLATFKVLYLEQHFTGDIGEFLRNNFLTTMAGKLTSPEATEFLHFFIAAGTRERPSATRSWPAWTASTAASRASISSPKIAARQTTTAFIGSKSPTR